MKALDGIKNIKIFDSTMFHIGECMETYEKYMKLLDGMPMRELFFFLEALRTKELTNNQEVENEPTLLMEFEALLERKNSIEMMTDCINRGDPITLDDVEKIHKRILKGTEDDLEKNYKYRNFDVRVSGIENGVEVISYLPPEAKEIIPYMEYILNYLNNDSNLQMETVFLKPIIAHAFIAILQPFGNGNTRIARLLQYGKIFDLTNKYFGKNYPYPILYLSKCYLLTRSNYRGNISQIAQFHNDENWNKWFEYNLNRIEDGLYYVMNNLENYYRRRK